MKNEYIYLLDIYFENIATSIQDVIISEHCETEVYTKNHIQIVSTNQNLHHLYVQLSRFFLNAKIELYIENIATDLILIHLYENKKHTTIAKPYWQHQYEIFGPEDTYQRLTELAPNMYHHELTNNSAYILLPEDQQNHLLSISNPF